MERKILIVFILLFISFLNAQQQEVMFSLEYLPNKTYETTMQTTSIYDYSFKNDTLIKKGSSESNMTDIQTIMKTGNVKIIKYLL